MKSEFTICEDGRVDGQPDLRLLATFLAVAREGSMAAAADALGYVPSAVSQHVAALERSLGVELVLRRPGSRLVLTAAGRALVRAAEPLFDATTRFQDLAHEIAGGRATELSLAAYPSATTYLLPRVLGTLRARHPALEVRLVDVETSAGLPLVRRGEVDVLIAYRYLPEDPPAPSDAWAVTLVGEEPMVLLAADTGEDLTLEDCVDRDWVCGPPDNPDRRMLHRWASGLGFAPRVTHETHDLHAMLALIRAGQSVGLVAATLLSTPEGRRGVQAVTLPEQARGLHREVLTITRPGRRPAVVEELLGLLGAELRRALAAAAAG